MDSIPPEILTIFGTVVSVIIICSIVMLTSAFLGNLAGNLIERWL